MSTPQPQNTRDDATRQRLQKITYVFSIVVVGAALMYWSTQIESVIETLRLAYG